jgi:hypothetical protein
LRIAAVRDLETIDSELRLTAAVRRVCREYDGRVPSITLVEELLDERGELTGSCPIVGPPQRLTPPGSLTEMWGGLPAIVDAP